MIPEGWVGPLATIIVAALGGIVALIVRKLRGPVAIQDLWAENRSLRTDLSTVEKKLEDLGSKIDGLRKDYNRQSDEARILAEGFDALSQYVERTSGGRRPSFTPGEHDAIERARALRGDALWNTINPRGPTRDARK